MRSGPTGFARVSRSLALILTVSLLATLPFSRPVAAQESTRIAYQLYEAMMGRFARGTPEQTLPTLRVLTETAADVAEVQYLYAIAVNLSGRGDREAAMTAAMAALASQPQNPLFQMAFLLSNPQVATRAADGVIVLNEPGVVQMRQILVAMAGGGSNNARVLSRELGRIEAAAEGVAGGRAIAFGNLARQAGLFTVKVEESRFRAAESAILARIEGGPQRISGEERAYRELEKRADQMISELYTASPDRVRALATTLKATLAEMGQVVTRIKNVASDLAAIFGPLRRGGEEIATLDADVRALEEARKHREEQVNTAVDRIRRTAAPR